MAAPPVTVAPGFCSSFLPAIWYHRWQSVVDQQLAIARLDGVGGQFVRGATVFELVGFLDGGERQLAFLADGREAHIQLVGRHGPAAAQSAPTP